MADMPKAEELFKSINYTPPKEGWMGLSTDTSTGRWCYPGKPELVKYLMDKGLPLGNPREWLPSDADWKLPPNWKEIIHQGFRERLDKFRSFKVFMDICVRCGACADKCHFFIGSGDPRNMPVLRAELMRSIYRKDFTLAGKILTSLTGSRVMEEDVLKEWFIYFYQCTECRRCSLFCPYGIDTAEITMMARELMHLVGLNINWIIEPVANCNRTGNHLGIQPHAWKDITDFLCGRHRGDHRGAGQGSAQRARPRDSVRHPVRRHSSPTRASTPSWGYLMLFHYLDLDYTWSTYASEGGNFGLFTTNEVMKKLNAKLYAEANRLGCKWILGGECGHMWRVINQYMDTMNGDIQGPQMGMPVQPHHGHGVQERGRHQDGPHHRVHRRPDQARQAEPG